MSDGLDILDQLALATGETCFLGVLRGDATVTVAESVPQGVDQIGSWVGRAYPAFCSDAGQAALWDADDVEVHAVFARTSFDVGGPRAPRSIEEFLSRLSVARKRGWAVVDEEAEVGLFSVAAPVLDARQEVVAAMQIVGRRSSLAPRQTELGRSCASSAAELSARLGFRGV